MKNQLLDKKSRTWTVNDNAWEEIGKDLQVIINCTKKGDVVLFNVTKSITPKKKIEIAWKITLSGLLAAASVGDTIPEAEKKLKIKCPAKQGLFHIRYVSL